MIHFQQSKHLNRAGSEKVREKLISILKENNGTENLDKNRFEQELIFYLEKFDINEEKVRLKKHCEYFLETIDTPAPNGKILSFIAQEIGREINTMGSKANDASIQKLVVMMKDELEKIKEQTNNISVNLCLSAFSGKIDMEGKLVIISAPSGAGKTTIVNHLLRKGLGLEFSISATTRAPRGKEKNGKEYYFISAEDFREKIRNE